ncbi:MAG: hypothetical protein K6E54_00110 [Bacteroidaceae bacterium]|nr:hypothetical protein [Bacteroidaceae bacterium]
MNKFLRLSLSIAALVVVNSIKAIVTYPVTILTEEASLNNWTITSNDKFVTNTWSTENDGSGISTPFIETWVESGKYLSDATISHSQITGLTAGSYTVSVVARVYNEKNSTDSPSGVSFSANGTSLDLAATGVKSIYNGESALVYDTLSVNCEVSEAGTLDISFALNNVVGNWLAFKNLEVVYNSATAPVLNAVEGAMNSATAESQKTALQNYTDNPTIENYEAALAAIANAETVADFYATNETYISTLDEDGKASFAVAEATETSVEALVKALIAAQKAQTTANSDLTYVMENSFWGSTQGDGPKLYSNGGTDTYNNSAFTSGKIIFQTIDGLNKGTYEVQIYATSNLAWIQGTTGANIAQVYANGTTKDIEVIGQTACTITDYLHTITAEVDDSGVLEYGIQNIADGGNWYVVEIKSLKLLEPYVENPEAAHFDLKYTGITQSNMTEGNNASSLNLDENVWTVTANQGDTDNYPRLFSNGYFGLYSSMDAGGKNNSITVSNETYLVDSIKITYIKNYEFGTISVNGNNVNVEENSDNCYIINSTEFTIGNSSDSKQTRIESIAIYYS